MGKVITTKPDLAGEGAECQRLQDILPLQDVDADKLRLPSAPIRKFSQLGGAVLEMDRNVFTALVNSYRALTKLHVNPLQ